MLVLFGATGDLARRKLLPGLFHLEQVGLMPEDYRIVGTSLSELDDEQLPRARPRRARRVLPHGRSTTTTGSRSASGSATCRRRPTRSRPASRAPRRRSGARRAGCTTCRCRRPPPGRSCGRSARPGWPSARAWSWRSRSAPTSSRRASSTTRCTRSSREDQIFRIDHFLGKEAALNMLTLRFANGFLEPLWNREHIDHVQIDVPETLSIGTRGEFYEGTGAFRDMVVTHLLQMLAVVAMEPPPSLEPRALVDEKLKVFRSAAADRARRRRARAVRGLPRRGRRRAGLRRSRPSSPRGCTSTTGAGRASRSSCAPASAWPRARA